MFAAPLQCTLADLPTMWEIPPTQCELLVYQDRRHLFVTPFYQLRVGERKFAVVVYCCNWKNAPKLYTLNRLMVLQTLQHQPYLKY
jgi:hypothetical protein